MVFALPDICSPLTPSQMNSCFVRNEPLQAEESLSGFISSMGLLTTGNVPQHVSVLTASGPFTMPFCGLLRPRFLAGSSPWTTLTG